LVFCGEWHRIESFGFRRAELQLQLANPAMQPDSSIATGVRGALRVSASN
jgi:hypothetical protein